MNDIFKKALSFCLILFFVFSQSAVAATCQCSCPCNCEQVQQCCPVQTQCCESCPCDCQTCDECECQNPCNTCCYTKIEHLCTNKNTPVNLVKICGCQAVINRHVVLETTLGQRIFSKKLCCGDEITFSLKNGLWTCEGRKILPACSQIVARVECIRPPRALNKGAQIGLRFMCVLLPDGRSYPICARIFTKEGTLKETKLMAAGKVALWTVGLFGVGSGLAAAIGAHYRHAGQAALTIGMPVGFGVGLLTGLLTPGLHYRGKCGEKVLIQLTDCLKIDLS